MEIASERGYALLILDGVGQLNCAHEMSWLPEPPRQDDRWASKMAVVSNFQVGVNG
jgi:hypothetical protein